MLHRPSLQPVHGGEPLALHLPAMHVQSVIAVEPAALVVPWLTAPHDVHVPPTTSGLPHELTAHEHAVIAAEPVALTAFAPHGMHVVPLR